MKTIPGRYAVFGHPIAQSLSPRIHAQFAKQRGLAISYEAIDASAEQFPEALAAFAAAGGKGANVTSPNKKIALSLCQELNPRARSAGAVNTLIRVGDFWIGDNTDGAGLVRDLTDRNAMDLRGRRTLLLGAGGAAHGITPALLDAGIGDLFIVNRHPEKADALADALGQPGRVHARYWEDLAALGAFDFIINATSAGREQADIALPVSIAGPRALAVDLSYGEAAIPFLAWARSARCAASIDGLGMLVEQAAESFHCWIGERPQTETIYTELRAQSVVLSTSD